MTIGRGILVIIYRQWYLAVYFILLSSLKSPLFVYCSIQGLTWTSTDKSRQEQANWGYSITSSQSKEQIKAIYSLSVWIDQRHFTTGYNFNKSAPVLVPFLYYLDFSRQVLPSHPPSPLFPQSHSHPWGLYFTIFNKMESFLHSLLTSKVTNDSGTFQFTSHFTDGHSWFSLTMLNNGLLKYYKNLEHMTKV